VAAWRHVDARDGFEVLFPRQGVDGCRFVGHTTAVEDGVGWSVHYTIVLDSAWATRRAYIVSESALGSADVRLERRGTGWLVDGRPAPELEGCADVDLEASAFTNALPVWRVEPDIGRCVAAPAAYVRAPDLTVEWLEQEYTRLESADGARYGYAAPAYDFESEIVYDDAGLVVTYPGIAERVL
jgi:hypothetical protein